MKKLFKKTDFNECVILSLDNIRTNVSQNFAR